MKKVWENPMVIDLSVQNTERGSQNMINRDGTWTSEDGTIVEPTYS